MCAAGFIGAANRKPGQFSCIGSRQIHREQAHNLPKLGFADFRTAVVPSFPSHYSKLTRAKNMVTI